MGEVSLFEHNEKAYKKLIEDLKEHKCTTINHATGTGKSFIALKYLYENRDKKYLYLAPTYPIIDQLLESCYKIGITPKDINIDTMIYRNLLSKNMEQIYNKYDGIIFDEYHRTGATKTYKKIKELKLMLKENDDGKKFIGLTATPIRYLDYERNMTKEIFDGNVASSISLSEAMLEELLPVPTYINSKIACREELEKAFKRVKKMYPTKERQKLLSKINEIDKNINNGIEDNRQLVNKYIKKENGKYIIFCNSIDELDKYYSEIDTWFEDIGKIKKYKVHSRNIAETKEIKSIKEINKKELDNFNKDKKGISVLFCVDILNEGVHVDNIDGVFMLRKTASPIIYFQQIGRALSFSGRNKEIKIFDLVNNFNNHMAIEMIYQELHEEFANKISKHPENKEKYEQILKRFKIMDETKDILNDISNIKKEVTKEKIIESKLEYSIQVLTNYVESGKNKIDLLQDDKAKKAYTEISKNYTYVTNKQFERLLQLNIVLPEEINMTMSERQERLSGYDSIQEKLYSQYNDCITNVIEFIKKNNRLPNMYSKNEEEEMLAKKYIYGLSDIDKTKKEEFKHICIEHKIKLDVWEKIIFDEQINRNDLNKIIELSQNYINNNREIPQYIKFTIEKVIRSYDIKENAQLFELLKQSEILKKEKLEKKQKLRYELINKIDMYLKQHINDTPEELNETKIIDIIQNLKPQDIKVVKHKYRDLKKGKYKENIFGFDKNNLRNFCKQMKNIEEKEIEEYCEKIEENRKIDKFTIDLIKFMINNNQKYPLPESEDEIEKNLAEQYKFYSKNEEMIKILNVFEKDKENKLYNPQKTIYELVLEREKQNETKLVILQSVKFLKQNGRRPFVNSSNEYESQLAIEYENKCIKELTNGEISILNKIFNTKGNFKASCDEYIKNIKSMQNIEKEH